MFDRNCSDITFILASRNDGYACNKDNWQFEQYNKINCCIYSAQKTFPESKFILIEYCPPKQNKRFKEMFSNYSNLTILTLNESLQEDLDKDNSGGKINFYEFISKHIGSMYVKTKYIVFINQDLFFPLETSEHFLESLRKDEINIAYRNKINYNLINLKTEQLYDCLNSVFCPNTINIDIFANGDFLAINKNIYNEIGGYLLCHRNWGVDNEILERVGVVDLNKLTLKNDSKYKINRVYKTFLLDHPAEINDRPRDFNFTKISSNIIKNVEKYIEEILEL
jgi:hypothetical protein